MSSGINFGGLASGMDTEGLISKLVSIQKQPIARLQQQQQKYLKQADVIAALKGQISNVAQSANSLLTADAFSAVIPSNSDSSVASLVMSGVGQAGNYTLSVSKLAQSQKISSGAQSSVSSALGQTGQFTINGKLVSVDSTDSLSSVARKINDVSPGATASIINGGTGNAYLTITSSNSGISGKPQLSDLTGSFLSTIGVLGATENIRLPITNGAAGLNFSSSSDIVGTSLGVTGLTGQTIKINGVNVSLNLQSDSLQAVADKINSASTGATASVVSVTEGVNTKYRLEITGASSPTFVDAGNTLATLGIVQKTASNELVAAQDASYKVDGVSLTSSTNTIEGVIPGGKITLLKADATTPPTTTLSIKSDTDAVANRIKSFTDSYNSAVKFITDNSQFDGDTYETGPLFGDPVARQFLSTMNSLLMSNIPGLTGNYKNLTDIGIRIDGTGSLSVDSSKLNTAIQTDSEGVRKLFQNFGSSSSSSVVYISGTSSTQPSSPSSYGVNITQVATKTQYVAATAKTSNNTSSETLTFSGNLIGSSSYNLTIDVGSNLQTIIDKINNDTKLKDLLTASNNSGKLQIDSKRFGSNGLFNVVSNQSPLGSNSGVGFNPGTLTNGLDVAGTINGESAMGVGQFLTGTKTDGKALGLQIQYSGTSTGNAGNITFTRGMSGIVNSALTMFTDIASGITVTTEKALRDQGELIKNQIDTINKRAAASITELRAKFSQMEQQISKVQQQGARLSQLTNTSTSK
ncbi:MAG: flagellar filament capping protein FliD [Fimbriimonadales bacterium]|nr:flagellar filament capping protein FliD [Fimbriimonadales bacterium]